MAITGIHFSDYADEAPSSFTIHGTDYRFIVVTVARDAKLYLPVGPQSPVVARALAAVLLEAAEAFERGALSEPVVTAQAGEV